MLSKTYRLAHILFLGMIYTFLIFFILVAQGFPLGEESMLQYKPLQEAQKRFNQGQFTECIEIIDQSLFEIKVDESQFFNSLMLKAKAQQYLGALSHAYRNLGLANQIGENLNPVFRISAMTKMSDFYLSVGNREKAVKFGEKALELARELKDPAILANALNNWGNLYTSLQMVNGNLLGDPLLIVGNEFEPLEDTRHLFRSGVDRGIAVMSADRENGQIQKAIQCYQESVLLAKESGQMTPAIYALLNQARAALIINDSKLAIESLKKCTQYLRGLPEGFEKGFLFLSVGVVSDQLRRAAFINQEIGSKLFSYEAYTNADRIGEAIKSGYLQSNAQGRLGHLYEQDQRLTEALRLTKSAIFYAQQVGDPQLLYRWQWQLGRLFNAVGKWPEAIDQYTAALRTLEGVQGGLTSGYRKLPNIFRDRIKPVYYELAELYLKGAERARSKDDRQINLRRARDIIESMKTAELQEYFHDECVTSLKAKETTLDNVIPGVAVIYPIVLKDRMVLLITLPDGIHQFSTNVDHWKVDKTAREFRMNLQNELSNAYKKIAIRLYKWLIQPLHGKLAQFDIDTLIFIPDSSLSQIPFSALSDGKEFLIEKYALVITPGLRMTEPESINRQDFQSLIFGLSKSAHGYPELPHVKHELTLIQQQLGGKSFFDENFTEERVTTELKRKNYRLMHMATHGEFSGDPGKTFLLAHDKKITLNTLERIIKFSKFREKPLELLTLSACNTAVGDERAAYGLAGIAVKSGARSVLASLWSIDDQATTKLITEFYRQYFGHDRYTKTQALQHVQKNLIASEAYKHPARWAPFLIIGNWL